MKAMQLILMMVMCPLIFLTAQETVNANDPASYVFGGGQGTNTATVQLLAVHLIDLEPEGNGVLVFGGSGVQEAGSPVALGSSNSNEETWINYSYRGVAGAQAQIKVVCNQPLPQGMSIKLKVIAQGASGNIVANASSGTINLSTSPKILVYAVQAGHTEDGINQGFQIQYDISNPNNESLPPGFEVVFTIE